MRIAILQESFVISRSKLQQLSRVEKLNYIDFADIQNCHVNVNFLC